MTGVAKNTVTKLLVEVGIACGEYQFDNLVDLPCKRIQADEIWSFCYAKDKNLPDHMRNEDGVGSIWTWTAICADTKLAVSWMVGKRDTDWAITFMEDIADRLRSRVQLSTDGLKSYLVAVPHAFGNDIDYATIHKIYGHDPDQSHRYSPPECIGCEKHGRIGLPLEKHVSTSFVERQNLTMRMCMRRFTRLTNGFSRKVHNLKAAINLHFMYYNFVRKHQTLKTTPAIAAGISDHKWEIEDIIKLLEDHERSLQSN